LGGLLNPLHSAGKKFNFKIKIVQTDLASRDYLFGMGLSDGFGGDPIVYQNSSYISKLYFINNYSGGILAKDKIEDMPEPYRRFIKLDNPTEAEMLKSFKKEMVTLSNREEIGHNVFYSRLSHSPNTVNLSNPSNLSDPPMPPSPSSSSSNPGLPGNSMSAEQAGEFGQSEYMGNIEGLGSFDSLESLVEALYLGGENLELEGLTDYPEDGDNGNGEVYEDYSDDEEIKNILLLNNVFTSDMYKMSKIEYDFNTCGNIILMDDGSLNIKYDESEMTGFKDSYIQFLFHTDNRDIVTVRRKHFFDTWFTLEKGKRVSIEQKGRYSGAISTTSTKELVNNITLDGGDMRIVYTTETEGSPSEMILYSIHAEYAEPENIDDLEI